MSADVMLALDVAPAEQERLTAPRTLGARSQHAPQPLALHCEWRPLADLGDIAPAWRRLAANALEPNVFYAPEFALAAAKKFGQGVGVVLVWSDDTKQRLTGFFPARIERHRYGMPFPMLVGWTHPYAPLGVPLVEQNSAQPAINAWLDFIAQTKLLPHTVLLPYQRQDGPFAALLTTALAERHGEAVAYDAHKRALLAPMVDRKDYFRHALSPKKRRELRRQANRLAGQGTLSLVHADDPFSMGPALEDFLRLESKGWKGRAASAAVSDPAARDFVVSAVEGLTASGQASITRLVMGDIVIAAGIVLRSGPTAWFWKIAYDEAYASASPGVQFTVGLTEHLLADATLAQTDSCATAEHPMIDHLWRERLSIADLLITPSPSATFTVASRLEHGRRRAIGTLRAIKRRLRL